MKDLLNNINIKPVINPAATATDNTAVVGAIIDRTGFESVTYIVSTGSVPDADVTYTALLEHGDASDMSDAATVPADQMLGTAALASFIFSDDNKVFKIGYTGVKQYSRLKLTPANNTGASVIGAICILGHPKFAPTVNPPA